MKRLTFITSAFLIVFAGCFNAAKADTVSRDSARKIAAGLLGGGTKSAGALKEVKIRNLDQANPEFYVFNDSDAKGFVIVSGDDSTMPILAYSDKFSFSEDAQMPPNVAYWMEYMQRKVKFARAHPGQIRTKALALSSVDFTPITKLETALWNQGAPYYNLTPTVSYNAGTAHCVTGCGQTAMAIMMKYHAWPDVGEGSTTAYSFTYNNTSYPVAAEDLSTHSYDWDNMLLDYSSGYTETQANAVALLMADLGKAQQADYGPDGTGSSPSTMGSVLANHFKYYNSLPVYRDHYSTDGWCSCLKAELDAGRPLLYAGWDTSGSGHSFILDGYAKYNFFSINWGWGGAYNGYFAIDIFQSEGQGIGGNDGSAYSEDQMTYTGLYPNKSGSAAPDLDVAQICLYNNQIYLVQGSYAVGIDNISRIESDTQFAVKFINRGPAASPYLNAGLRIQNHDGSLIASTYWTTSPFQLNANYSTNYYVFSLGDFGYDATDIKFGAYVVPALKNYTTGSSYDVTGVDEAKIPAINAAYIDCAESYSAGQTFDKKVSYGWTKPQSVTWTYDGALSDGDIVLTSGHHTITATLQYALPMYSEVLEIEIDVN